MRAIPSFFSSEWRALLLLGAVLAGYGLALDLPGTPDIPNHWLAWSRVLDTHGLAEGYRLANADYPPGSFLLLFLIRHGAGAAHLAPFLAIKICLAAAALLGGWIFWRWLRQLWPTVALLAAVLLNSAALGYLDALYFPFLLLSLTWLQRDRLEYASLAFCLAVSIKWQPLIIAPFWLAYACALRRENLFRPGLWLAPLGRVARGALPVAIAAGLIFSPIAILKAFHKAIGHAALSYQGLNPNWMVQALLARMRGFTDIAAYELEPPRALMILAAVLFWGSYASLLFIFLRRPRRFAEFLWFAAAGFYAYFTLNTGVHENHLFVPMVLAFAALAAPLPGAVFRAGFVALAANLNLLLFYGFDGRPLASPIAFFVGLAVCVANAVYLTTLLRQAPRWSEPPAPLAPAWR